MSAPRPRIVVSLPARTVAEASAEVRRARDGGADAAELRVDRFAPDQIPHLAELFPSEIPLVATYRSRAEGGEGSDDPAVRAAVLCDLAAHPFRWIDLELDRDLDLLARLPGADRLGRVVSYHARDGADPPWRERLAELEGVDGIGKLVVPATVRRALTEILPAVERVGENIVVHTTGPSGALLRAWSRRLGFPLVYAALPDAEGVPPVEASQIAVDRLRPYLDADEPAPLFGVCGRPIDHSLSPGLHTVWMREDHEPGLYVALEFADDQEFLEALAPLAQRGLRGLNVTHPFKAIAAEASNDLGPGARACGAANCLTFDGDEMKGENTDLLAILRRLEELKGGGRWDGGALVVVGAGGAARATLAAARELGARAGVLARRRAEAEALASEFGARVADPSRDGPASLLVHATPVGREPGQLLDLAGPLPLANGGHLLDWVYAPATPVVRQLADLAGATYEDGWRLLVYQAAASHEIWWGHPPAEASIARAVTEGPCEA